MQDKLNLSVDLNGLRLQNPVMTASGTFGYGGEFWNLTDLDNLGAIVVKGISLEPSPGNPPPRIAETAAGMLNAIGLENIGFEAFIKERLPFLRKQKHTVVIANIYGTAAEQYGELAAKFNEVEGVHAVEVNISCPNVKCGGAAFGSDPKMVEQVVTQVRAHTQKHVMVKLSPNVTDIAPIAQSAEFAGADSVSLINTLIGMAIDVRTRRPVLANVTGGLSGPAIKPVALRFVWQAAKAVKIPVVGIGGIMTATDALEFMIAGASAVQIGLANFIKPGTADLVIAGIREYMEANNISDINEIVGSLVI